MTFVATGPTDAVISALFNQPKYDEHVKDYRWFQYVKKVGYGETYALHVLDYRLHNATKEIRRALT